MSPLKKFKVRKPQRQRVEIEVYKKRGKYLKAPVKRNVLAPKFRPSLTPGTVLILLAGPYRGRRVLHLKNLASGLVLTTGPFEINGVPLRRIHPNYVIATSTKLSEIGTDEAVQAEVAKVDDSYFKKSWDEKKKLLRLKRKRWQIGKGEGQEDESIFMDQEEKLKKNGGEAPEEKKKMQMEVDAAVMAVIKKGDPLLRSYLKSRFALSFNQYPHLMKF